MNKLPDLVLEGVVYRPTVRRTMKIVYELPNSKKLGCEAMVADEADERMFYEDMTFRVNQINADPESQRQVLEGEYLV